MVDGPIGRRLGRGHRDGDGGPPACWPAAPSAEAERASAAPAAVARPGHELSGRRCDEVGPDTQARGNTTWRHALEKLVPNDQDAAGIGIEAARAVGGAHHHTALLCEGKGITRGELPLLSDDGGTSGRIRCSAPVYALARTRKNPTQHQLREHRSGISIPVLQRVHR